MPQVGQIVAHFLDILHVPRVYLPYYLNVKSAKTLTRTVHAQVALCIPDELSDSAVCLEGRFTITASADQISPFGTFRPPEQCSMSAKTYLLHSGDKKFSHSLRVCLKAR